MLSFVVQDYVLEHIYSKWKHESAGVFGKVAHATVAIGIDHSRMGRRREVWWREGSVRKGWTLLLVVCLTNQLSVGGSLVQQ